MNFISRELLELIEKKIQPNKVIVLLGARRVGKTFLLKELVSKMKGPYLFLNGEDINVHEALREKSVENFKRLLGGKETLIIDEAQKINDIGGILKLMVDEIPGLKVIVTGSSAFDIKNLAGEPLTGRKYTYVLYSLSERECSPLEDHINSIDRQKMRLVYGNYPELLHIPDLADKREYLNEVISSYLLKDILIYENIKNSGKIFNLLKMVAFQLGNEVSYQELGNHLGMSKNTVEKYLDLLSKVFVLVKVEGFSRNLRKEVTKSPRWYFLDNGIRNAVIANFNSIDRRDDLGQLWGNHLITERLKYQQATRMVSNNYFWRTYEQQEIDWVEEREGKLYGYEFKWKKGPSKAPSAWTKTYQEAEFKVITQENYQDWLGIAHSS